MINIIGGEWRGHKLKVLSSAKLRPSSSKVRGAIFNIIESIRMKNGLSRELNGYRCLELYAGTGALGFEALSRGADFCVFVEKSREHAKVLVENAEHLQCQDRIVCICQAVERALANVTEKSPYDVIFADPPYHYEKLNDLFTSILQLKLLSPSGLLVLEHDPRTKLGSKDGFRLISQRILGPAGISIFTDSR